MSVAERLYSGSVKDVYAFKDHPDQLIFQYSDAFSVFDWGRMPDELPGKGEALALLAAYLFEACEKMGFKTHYLGLLEEGRVVQLSELKKPTRELVVRKVHVDRPEFKDRQYVYPTPKTYPRLVPLEVIFRYEITQGSSILSRLSEAEKKSQGIFEGARFEKPLLEVFTKLESRDRFLTNAEAERIATLSQAKLLEVYDLAAQLSQFLKTQFEKYDLRLADGKFEFGQAQDSSFFLIDAIGPDELRVLSDIQTARPPQLSKEFLRVFYRDSEWYKSIESAKKEAIKRGQEDWKKLVAVVPPRLPPDLKKLVSQLYQTLTNTLTEKTWFKDVPSLSDLLDELMGESA